VTHDQNGGVLDVGRRTRTIPNALRRALDARDGGCCFPGCGLRFTDGHHIIHWADDGPTNLSNLCLLCEYHHRLVHEGGYRVQLQARGQPTFYDARGLPVPDAPPQLRLGESAADALVQENRARGVNPDFRTGMARYRCDEDIPWHVVVSAVNVLDAANR